MLDLQSASWDTAESFTVKKSASRFESFERNLAGQIGLGLAVEYANSLGIIHIAARIQSLAERLVAGLQSIQGVRIHELSEPRSGIVTFSKTGAKAAALQSHLYQRGINTSISKRKNAMLDLDREMRDDVIRASLHYYNSGSEIERFMQVIDRF